MQRPASTPSATSTWWLRRGWLMTCMMLPAAPALGSRAPKTRRRDARVHDRSGAHRAGLQRDVELAAAEAIVAERAGGLAQGLNLGVGAGIAGWRPPGSSRVQRCVRRRRRRRRPEPRPRAQPAAPAEAPPPSSARPAAGPPRVSSSFCIDRMRLILLPVPAASCSESRRGPRSGRRSRWGRCCAWAARAG